MSITTLEAAVTIEFYTEENGFGYMERIPAYTTAVFCHCYPNFWITEDGVRKTGKVQVVIRGHRRPIREYIVDHKPGQLTFQWIALPERQMKVLDGTTVKIKRVCTAPSLKTLAIATVRAYALQRTLQPGDLPPEVHHEVMMVEESHFPMLGPDNNWELCPYIEPLSLM